MANNYFEFKQFRVDQDGSAMKVGTDGVLLGAWADISKANRILDIGTGTGLIAMMMGQRTNSDVKIDAVEIELSSYQQAVNNFENCPWTSRLSAFHLSFQEFCQITTVRYDLIVSNPPYFLNGLKAKCETRTQARHADYLPFEDLLKGAMNLLTESGVLSVVLPVEEGEYFQRLAGLTGFYLKRKISVLPNPGKPAKRYLLEFCLQKCEAQFAELIVENGERHVYSPEYINLTKDFYLKF
ncbi:tRNA1(Val) (adenine(37)-N6)-methyltransferase [Labilibaculum euxinus]|uniref:tRNA1(Val) (adenine(37)-N6)-methyltransferase n=1 Tax=Labilibaculum euxinus TaxID=2686357 RepID=A0A7M4D388_9BACT|nr:methyltransferase [Labilibaculum euxinus]MUP37117.1 methyltransferase [Labilibaculum euxinus]MVB06322.1 methyltransferase [Labilibaculum euxinus]